MNRIFHRREIQNNLRWKIFILKCGREINAKNLDALYIDVLLNLEV